MGGNLLSDAALHQVRELIRQESGRARGERTWEEPKLHVGPEVFLAYHVSGIAAMTGTTPGSAECDLYEIGTDGTLSALMMDGTTNNKRTVRNASASAVGAGYFPVWKDKLGTWWATAAGSSAQVAFCAAAVDAFRNGFLDGTATKFPYSSAGGIVRGSSLVTLDNPNDQVIVTQAGLWHAWGSVTVRVDTVNERTTHVLAYLGPATSGTFDTQYRSHVLAGATNLDVVYLAGAVTLEANTAVYFASRTDSGSVTGYWSEFNLHLMKT